MCQADLGSITLKSNILQLLILLNYLYYYYSRPCMLEDFFQSHVMLLLINASDKNIVNNIFNTFSVLEYL